MDFDPLQSSQVTRVSYDSSRNVFIIYTSEGYKLEFQVGNRQ